MRFRFLTAFTVLPLFTCVTGMADKAADTKVPSAAKGKVRLESTFAAGSKWKGIVREFKGPEELTTDVLIVVTKRDGKQFQGTYEVFSGLCRYLIEGTIERNQVMFKFVKLEKIPTRTGEAANLVGVQNKGTLRLDNKTMKPTIMSFYTWEGPKDASIVRKGTVTVALVDEQKPDEKQK